MEPEKIGHKIIGAAIEVHRELSLGLLESTDERSLMHALMLQGLKAERQKKQPINYPNKSLRSLRALRLIIHRKQWPSNRER